MMKHLLRVFLFGTVLSACSGKLEEDGGYRNKNVDAGNEINIKHEFEVEQELFKQLIEDNPSIDTSTYRLLLGAGFPEKDSRFYSYGGSLVTYAEVWDDDMRAEKLAFADANLTSDTLHIAIKPVSSLSELFGGWGIGIIVTDNKFSSHYYSWTDIEPKGYRIEAMHARLSLNSSEYEKGDTIAGRLFFRSKDEYRYASGYFRAIIR